MATRLALIARVVGRCVLHAGHVVRSRRVMATSVPVSGARAMLYLVGVPHSHFEYAVFGARAKLGVGE
eukprot:6906083-Alexandrium_andersonii.AAC.1